MGDGCFRFQNLHNGSARYVQITGLNLLGWGHTGMSPLGLGGGCWYKSGTSCLMDIWCWCAFKWNSIYVYIICNLRSLLEKVVQTDIKIFISCVIFFWIKHASSYVKIILAQICKAHQTRHIFTVRSGLKGIFLAVHVVLKSPRMRLTGHGSFQMDFFCIPAIRFMLLFLLVVIADDGDVGF